METPNIVPITSTSSGVGYAVKNARLLAKQLPSGVILDAANNYEVRVERLYCPVNSDLMPIDVNEEGYKINLFCDVKTPPDPAIPGLVYGNNIFTITGEIYSVEDLLNKINNLFLNWTLGTFLLNHTTELIEFRTVGAEIHTKVKIYLEARLADMLLMKYEPPTTIGEVPFYQFGWKFWQQDNMIEIQKKFTQNRFYKIQNIRIYTDLPTYYIESNDTAMASFESSLLHQVSYNSSSMSEVIDILYQPNDRYMRSLCSTAPITRYECRLYYQYENGAEIPVRLHGWQKTYVTLCFERIHKI